MDTQQDMDATMQGKSIAGPVDIMIDIETNGLKPGCAIANIGTVTFGPNGPSAKHYFQGFASVADERFVADRGTMDWWLTKPEAVRALVFGGTEPIDLLLCKFTVYLTTYPVVRVWGNAASFDLKILERAYEICGLELPWDYRNEMCYRTLKNLYPQIPYRKPRTGHEALEDAIAQATHADEIFAYQASLMKGAGHGQ